MTSLDTTGYVIMHKYGVFLLHVLSEAGAREVGHSEHACYSSLDIKADCGGHMNIQ